MHLDIKIAITPLPEKSTQNPTTNKQNKIKKTQRLCMAKRPWNRYSQYSQLRGRLGIYEWMPQETILEKMQTSNTTYVFIHRNQPFGADSYNGNRNMKRKCFTRGIWNSITKLKLLNTVKRTPVQSKNPTSNHCCEGSIGRGACWLMERGQKCSAPFRFESLEPSEFRKSPK